jgi:ABC-type dipeptide/oligopeptide/nickel transport system permease subunit
MQGDASSYNKLKAGSFILAESALSFRGPGVQPPDPTWGSMVSPHRNHLPSAPWMAISPGGAIALTALASICLAMRCVTELIQN